MFKADRIFEFNMRFVQYALSPGFLISEYMFFNTGPLLILVQ